MNPFRRGLLAVATSLLLAGTALLLAVVIGSGIMAERLSAGNTAVALLATPPPPWVACTS